MADLGSLFYSLYLKDHTDEDLDKIKKKLENIRIELGYDFNENTVDAFLKKLRDTGKAISDNKAAQLSSDNVAKAAQDTRLKQMEREARILGDIQAKKSKAMHPIDSALNYARTREAISLPYESISYKNAQNRLASYIKSLSREADAQERMRKAAEKSIATREREAKAAQRQTNANNHLNTSIGQQSRLLTGLRDQLLNVYSIYSLERFATSLVEIGGEFQKQRIALQAMLGDAEKADAMYSKIKNLAIESPFNFKELMGYTKQLSAFSIPYNELYDTTKRLADISSGLGVDMGRIILAYGQVRSAAFLRGQEVRQFTEAGIPLLDELAKKFSQLENRVVSVGDVFDKISRREVPFQMVKDVLWDLTNEGGKFYNMQEVLTESLSGKLAKLKDSYEIMLSEIAQANNGLLGGTLDMLSSVMDHWRELLPVLSGIIASYGAYKAVLISVNAIQKANLAINKISAIVETARAIQGLTRVTKAQAVAQYALNAAMAANPYYLAAAAIGVLIGSMVYLANAETSAEKATKHHREEQEKFQSTLDERKSEIDELIRTIQDETETEYRQISAYEKLKTLSPDLTDAYSREQLAVLELSKAQKVLNEARDKLNYDNIIKNINKYTSAINGLKRKLGDKSYNQTIISEDISNAQDNLDKWKQDLSDYNRLKKEAEDSVKPVEVRLFEAKASKDKIQQEFLAAKMAFELEQEKFKKGEILQIPIDVELRFINAQNALKDIINKISSLPSDVNEVIRNKSYWESIKKDAEEARDDLDVSLVGGERWNKLTETIKNAQKELDKFSDKEKAKDHIAELWKKRIDLIDKALSSYKEWSALEGKDAASNRVKENVGFKELFNKNNGFSLDLDNPEEAWKFVLGKLGKTEKQKELNLSIEMKLDKSAQGKIKEELDKSLKEIQLYVDDTTKKWDLFKSIREKTGNKKFAMQLAFGELNVGETDMLKGFREEIEKGIEGKGISFEDVLKMDEASMKDAGISSIEPYVKAYNDGMMQLRKDTADNLAELVSKYRDYATQVTEIENKLNDDLADIESNRHKLESGGVDVDKMIAERKKRANEEKGSVAFEQFKESSDWVRIFDDLDRVCFLPETFRGRDEGTCRSLT